jgi:hypothetical protein
MPLTRSGHSRDDHRRSPMRSLTNPNRKPQLSAFRASDRPLIHDLGVMYASPTTRPRRHTYDGFDVFWERIRASGRRSSSDFWW